MEVWAAENRCWTSLVEQARADGLMLTWGRSKGKLDDHLGYGKRDRAGHDAAIPVTASGPTIAPSTGT